jgi:hypothetical protein
MVGVRATVERPWRRCPEGARIQRAHEEEDTPSDQTDHGCGGPRAGTVRSSVGGDVVVFALVPKATARAALHAGEEMSPAGPEPGAKTPGDG